MQMLATVDPGVVPATVPAEPEIVPGMVPAAPTGAAADNVAAPAVPPASGGGMPGETGTGTVPGAGAVAAPGTPAPTLAPPGIVESPTQGESPPEGEPPEGESSLGIIVAAVAATVVVLALLLAAVAFVRARRRRHEEPDNSKGALDAQQGPPPQLQHPIQTLPSHPELPPPPSQPPLQRGPPPLQQGPPPLQQGPAPPPPLQAPSQAPSQPWGSPPPPQTPSPQQPLPQYSGVHHVDSSSYGGPAQPAPMHTRVYPDASSSHGTPSRPAPSREGGHDTVNSSLGSPATPELGDVMFLSSMPARDSVTATANRSWQAQRPPSSKASGGAAASLSNHRSPVASTFQFSAAVPPLAAEQLDRKLNAIDMLEQVLDDMHYDGQLFMDTYTVAGAVDRRAGGQGVVQFASNARMPQAVALKVCLHPCPLLTRCFVQGLDTQQLLQQRRAIAVFPSLLLTSSVLLMT